MVRRRQMKSEDRKVKRMLCRNSPGTGNREAMSKREMTRVSEMKRIQGKIPAAVQYRVPGLVRKAVQGRIQMAGSRRLR